MEHNALIEDTNHVETVAPLQKAASQSSSKQSEAEEAGDAQQSGRSSTRLRAERAAASIRESDRRALDKSVSAPDILLKKPSSDSHRSGLDTSSAHSPSTLAPQSQHLPSISPPLNVHSLSSPNNYKPEAGTQRRPHGEWEFSSTHPPTAKVGSPPRRRPHPRPPIPRPKHKSTPELDAYDLRPAGSALTMRDLGADYTRYFNPFTDSARSASLDKPTTPLSPSRAITPAATSNISNPFSTPNASTTKLNADYDPEKNGSLIDDRLSAPYDEKGNLSWPLWGDKEEEDDAMHLPQPDDDIRYKARWKDHFSRANIASTIGLILMITGLLFLFIALPVLSYAGVIDYTSGNETPLDQMPKAYPAPEPWAQVNNQTYPLLKNLRIGLIDPDTPDSAMSKIGEYSDEYELVFSDEFNDNNRTFYEGDDPYWFAPDIWYGATQDLEWYDPDAVTTWDGVLELRLDKFINHGLNYRSGMLNSWNHLCFKGGIFEVSMSLPGPAGVMGLWPGVWTLGNLGRPGYMATTDGMWPYTYQACDAGITPNQSSYDGLSRLPGQRLPSCTCPGEDHPTPGTGRGAPEIDIAEVGTSYLPVSLPIATQSYQVAPFDIWYYPDYDFTAFPDPRFSSLNRYTGGPYQEAISATTNLNKDWYDGKAYQKYSFEYVPGEGAASYIVWKVGGQTMFVLDGRAIGPNGNIQARQISQEPMSLVLNLGISETWSWVDWERLVFPTVMRIDYVRWYQKKGERSVTCDPPGWETTRYIRDHGDAYKNPNFTKWEQTGYAWPKHKLNSDC